MKLAKLLIASVVLSGALVTTAQARDSVSIGINVGGFDHYHGFRGNRHAPVYYGHLYSAPPVVFYGPSVRYRHFDNYYGGRYCDDRRSFRGRHDYYRDSRNRYNRGRYNDNRGRRGWR